MGTPKDRLHRVLVIGATPAGLAATNKLGEMGIPVTLVDLEPDLDTKLSREEWRLASGLPLNYALRPGLLRILRNPRIRCVLPGKVSALRHTRQGFSARLQTIQTFVDPDRCTLCGRCAEICPVSTPSGLKPIQYRGRQSLPGRPVIDKRRQPLCQASCPLGVNAQGYIALAKVGKFAEALDLIRRDNVLPGICGRVCTHPCELACRRGELDDPVAIKDIKRYVADYELSHPQGLRSPSVSPRPERIAIIGSGPSGLAAAADLARLGYSVAVYDKEEMPGGLLRYGVGAYRLPRNILDHELDYIKNLGVRFSCSTPVDFANGLVELKKEFSAIILTTGAWTDRKLRVPGEDLEGVEGCLEFFGKVHRGEIKELKENVAVIGDGNAAFDLARTLVRLGAHATIVSWFPEDLIPADRDEINAARGEGISIIDRAQVTGFSGRNGRLNGLRCAPTRPGEPDGKGIPWPVIVPGKEPFDLPFNRAIVAIGQVGDPLKFAAEGGVRVTASGFIEVDEACRTGMGGIYAAGDAADGPSSVVAAMASGRRAARAVHFDLSGEGEPDGLPRRPEDREFPEITQDIPSLPRLSMPGMQPADRKDIFGEVAPELSEAQVLAEAARCIQCGVCSECLQCLEVCPSAATIRHHEPAAEVVDHAGVVIIADPDAAPAIKGEDVIRAYGSKGRKTDVYAMMLRGFAAAAEAMILLGGISQRLKGHGLSFSPPDPRLSPELRLGVFVCRCNDALGWSPELDRYVAGLTERINGEHAEVLASACTPEGSSAILRTIREKGLTRVVLASCVCCPLDFICSTCTDQRSRLKDALFKGTGVSRAMVETCNVRGEVLRLLKTTPQLAIERFKGLIDRSIRKARLLKALPTPARPYDFTTAVIGNSEASLKSALTIAEAGMEVFLFGTPDKPLFEPLIHPNIHNFGGYSVTALRGTVGNFQVIAEANGFQQVLQAGAVILGERCRKRIPYMPMAELPPRVVESAMQKRGVVGIPFFSPGATSVPGLFLANPPGMNVSERIKGTAAAILAMSAMPRGPRKNKGYTVVVDESRCRGCGRCVQVCPYHAVSFSGNAVGGWHAVVDEALCKGCGNCIAICPSSAADSPYRERQYLEQMIEEILL
jgi:NADPH-dependent glutamate synthase beta subunit-like oxidoreductase/NAD-dependent dihydropyrimidine dehydrogenase PreA subunit